jgi:hypothetical protein
MPKLKRSYRLDESTAAQVTSRTLQHLRRCEERAPGFVQSVLVWFKNGFDPGQMEFLRNAGGSQFNREIRDRLAWENADRMQADVRNLLSRDGGRAVAEFFADSPDFIFEPSRHVHSFHTLNVLVTPATSGLAELLSRRENVLAVQRNLRLSRLKGDHLLPLSGVVVQAGPGEAAGHRGGFTWGLHCLGIPRVHQQGLTGRVNEVERIILGLADTGVCEDHPDLQGKVLDSLIVEDSGRGVPAHSFDRRAHGTHCAGTMVGGNLSGTQIGVAPDARLKVAAVLDGQNGRLSALLKGLNWLADRYRAVSAVNLSLRIVDPRPEDLPPLNEAIDRLGLMDMVCVAAIGNDKHVSMYPARLPSVLGCGAIGPDGQVWEHSGASPDLILPGVDIYSSIPPGPRWGYRSWWWRTGTSCAAAHLTALVGLLRQACPDATAEQVRRALRDTASNNGSFSTRTGFGVPQFWQALSRLQAR